MTPDEFKNCLRCAMQASKLSSQIIMGHFKKSFYEETKSGRDIATAIDFESEEIIINYILNKFPSHNIFTEESEPIIKKGSNISWIIDPIDGTINYASKFPFFSISIALEENKNIIFGLVRNPVFENLYLATYKSKSTLNEKEIRVSKTKLMKDSLISVVITSHFSDSLIDKSFEICKLLAYKTRGIRVMVCSSIELCFIAQGILEGNICLKSDLYSNAAGYLILKKAGGTITDIKGNPYSTSSNTIVASNSWIHNELLKLLSTF